jgi:acetylornithine/succinyldiaminopimelate/putrescine aminotransferase
MESIFHEDPFIHVSTFGGAELGCRVAMRVLEVSSSSAFLNYVNMLADRFRQGVERLQKDHGDFLLGFRQLGLMMGLKLKDDVSGPVMSKAAYDNGLLMVYANNDTSVCQFLPPLVISLDQVDEVMEKLDKALGYAAQLKEFF